jgi:UDP-glucose 4-epimerase
MNTKVKKVAITGGSGFIGSAIYRQCLEHGQEVILYDRTEPPYKLPEGVSWFQGDITDKDTVTKFVKEVKPEQIYLVAGLLGTSELNKSPRAASEVNVTGTANFMELAVNGELPPVFYPTKPNVWENMYTITKESSERIVKLYMKEYGLKGAIHKWFNVYGPGQHTHPIRKAVPYFILMAAHNLPLHIHGTGNQTMDLIHVDDAAKIAFTAMNNGTFTNQDVVEVGTGTEVTVNALAEMVIRLCNSSSKIVHNQMREGELLDTKLGANTTLLKKVVGDDFKYLDLEEGMVETINFYKQLPKEKIDSALEFYSNL